MDGLETGILEIFATSSGTAVLGERPIAFDVGGGTFCVAGTLFFRIDLGPAATEPVSTFVFVLLFAGAGLLTIEMPPFPALPDETLSSSSESFRLLVFLPPSSLPPLPKLLSTIFRSLGSPDGVGGPSLVPVFFEVSRVGESAARIVGVGDTNTDGAGKGRLCENKQ